ncbi:Nephrocystin-3 [Paramyrothecium foliicola]|nr:Nephrocystin-3 [Paramyrothecium foliicola]
MSHGIHCLYSAPQDADFKDLIPVDIVAVHDVYEDPFKAWTHQESNVNWLQDLLPSDVAVGRIVAYGYDATMESFLAGNAHQNIQRMAESLVQELRGNRQFAGTLKRPIIFICHGLGGLLVKQSLVYSSTRTAPKVVHLWDQFVSTFAILFFGTPHGQISTNKLEALDPRTLRLRRSTIDPVNERIPLAIENAFSPLIKQFHLFFFWEELPTAVGRHHEHIVSPESAAPKIDNTETAGIHATHSEMVKFGSKSSSDYRTVIAALSTYCEKAPAIISHRWTQAEKALKQLREGEAWELGGFGFDVHSEEPFRNRHIPVQPAQTHFYPPQPLSPGFVGRLDLVKLIQKQFFLDETHDSRQSHQSFVVFGMGGSGKTQLCAKYAHDLKHQYSAVFTVYAATRDTITDSFCRIGQLAGLEPTENAGRHYLSQLTDNWLLIIDNADDRLIDLQSLFPESHKAHILITTRCPDFRVQGTLGYLELRGLEPNEALKLLLTKANIPVPWDNATKKAAGLITKALGYLALALIQAGNCIFRGICGLTDYLKLHSSARKVLSYKNANMGEEDDSVVKAIYSTFDVSLEILLKRPILRRQDASDLLKIICFFHFEHIPVELFARAIANRMEASIIEPQSLIAAFSRMVLKRLEPPKALPGFLKDDAKTDRYRVNWAIAELRSLSLVHFDGKYISLHPLVHAWARDSLDSKERGVWASVALNTLLESVSLPPKGSSDTDGEFHRDIVQHLESCLSDHGGPISKSFHSMGSVQWLLAKAVRPSTILIMRDQVHNAAKCGWVFAERGVFEKAKDHLEMVKDVLLNSLGSANEKTTNAMLGLAGIHWGLGQPEKAIELQRTVVNGRTKILGATNIKTLQAMNQLGRSYWLHGMHQEALDIQEVTAACMKESIGPDHSNYADTLAALDNLGVTLSAWRRFHESVDIHQEVLRAREKLLGTAHSDTLSTKANLAMALLDLGNLGKAQAFITDVYDQRRQIFGKEHPWTLWALCYLSKTYIESGDLEKAEKILLEGIEAGMRSLGKGHIGVQMGRGELARVYARQGRFNEAEELTLSTIAQLKKSCGTGHPDYIYALWKLSQLYILKGERGKAIEASKEALERSNDRLTPSHPLRHDLEKMVRELNVATLSASCTRDKMPKLSGNPVEGREKDSGFLPRFITKTSDIGRKRTW